MKLVSTVIVLLICSGIYAVELSYDKVRNNLRGIRNYERENIDEAIEYFEKNVINNPGEGKLHFNLGNSYYRQEEYDLAINEYSRALRDKNFTNSSDAWHNIGNSFFQQQEYKDALDMYRNAIITNPDNADARYNYELARLMLEAMQNQEQPQSSQSDSKEQVPLEKSDENSNGDDAEVFSDEEENDGGDDQQESRLEKEADIENAENIMRSLLSKEKELLEEERERNRKEQNFRGRFW